MRPITPALEYLKFLREGLDDAQMRSRIDTISTAVLRAWKNDRRVFVCGNGGSSAIASHFVNDLLKFIPGGLPAVCLSDNVPFITAVANDDSYDAIFREQLVVSAEKDDLLVAISCSGKSANVVEAVNSAAAIGMDVVALTAGVASPLVKSTAQAKGQVCYFYHPDIRGQEDLISIALHISVGEVSEKMMEFDEERDEGR